MPRRDGTGPAGCGPMTGKGNGVCYSADVEYYHRGRGYGMGGRRCCQSTQAPFFAKRELSPDEKKEMLTKQREFLQEEINNINSTLDEL